MKSMDNKEYKSTYKIAACTQNPIEHLIPKKIRHETLLKIKNECLDIYGYDVMNECSKRKVCLKKQCIGRPLAWESPTAKPYLEQLKKTQIIKNDQLYITSNCIQCPIANSCKSLCNQISDFINRDYTQEPNIKFTSLTENTLPENQGITPEILTGNLLIPWDVLPNNKVDIIKKYIYEQRDFVTVAKSFGILNRARAKYFLYAALTKLSEYAIMRRFISSNKNKLTNTQFNVLYNVYFANKKLTEVAKDCEVTKQAVSKLINQVIQKNNIKWFIFVKKEKNKIIYNVPSILK